MKIKPEHVEYIKATMLANSSAPLLQNYLKVGLTEKRWRWDWLLYCKGMTRWIIDNIYPYADDTHIDTVLRHITKSK